MAFLRWIRSYGTGVLFAVFAVQHKWNVGVVVDIDTPEGVMTGRIERISVRHELHKSGCPGGRFWQRNDQLEKAARGQSEACPGGLEQEEAMRIDAIKTKIDDFPGRDVGGFLGLKRHSPRGNRTDARHAEWYAKTLGLATYLRKRRIAVRQRNAAMGKMTEQDKRAARIRAKLNVKPKAPFGPIEFASSLARHAGIR